MDAPEFVHEIQAVVAADHVRAGRYVHVYDGRLADRDCPLRFFALAPGVEAGVRETFDRVVDQWLDCDGHDRVATARARGREPRPWIAVESHDGVAFDAEAGRLRLATLRTVVADLADAVQHVHRQGGEVGVLDPGGFRVVEENGQRRGYVADWGLETACGVAAGHRPGSPLVPPEYHREAGVEPARVAVYALAAAVAAGIAGPSSPERRRIEPDLGDIPDVSDEGPEPSVVLDSDAIHPSFAPVLATALAADPADRYATPYEFKLAVLFDVETGAKPGQTGSGTDRTATRDGSTTRSEDERADVDPDRESEGAAGDKPAAVGERVLARLDEAPIGRRAALGLLGAGLLGGGSVAAAVLDSEGSDRNPGESRVPRADGVTDGVTGDGTAGVTALFGATAENSTPPNASFHGEYDGSRLRIHHEGGEPIDASSLVVRGTGLADSFEYAVVESPSVESEVAPGQAFTLAVDPEYELALVWEGEERQEVLTTFRRQSTGDADPRPAASFSFGFDDESVTVTVEEADGVPAGDLIVRGTGFAGAPGTRWSRLGDTPPSHPVSAGDTRSVGASAAVTLRVVWDGDGTAEPVVLDQYTGPGRPLDEAVGGWVTHQHDSRNTGHAPAEEGPVGDVVTRWHAAVGGSVQSSPVVAGGAVYVGSTDGRVYALDAADGTELWRFDAGSAVRGAPAVSDGRVFVGSVDGDVYALDAADGTERWQTDVVGVVSSPVPVEGRREETGTVYQVSRSWAVDGVLHALDAADGTERWRFDGVDAYAMPAVETSSSPDWSYARRTVYASSGEGQLYALRADEGARRWTYQTGDHRPTTPAVAFHGNGDSNRLYVTTAASRLHAVETSDGSGLWTVTPGAPELSAPTVVDSYDTSPSGLTVVLSAADGTTYALDGTSGDPYWNATTEAQTQSTPVVVDGTVYVSAGVDYSSALSAFDATDGSHRWRFSVDEQRRLTSPAVVDGTVYVATARPSVHERTTGTHESSVYALTDAGGR